MCSRKSSIPFRSVKPGRTVCRCHQEPHQGHHLDRRTLLSAAALTTLLPVAAGLPAAAVEQVAEQQQAGLKRFDGKAGYHFSYPDTWVSGFNRNEGGGTGALGLAGDFKTFDTASVLKADLGRLKDLPPTAAEKGDVKALAQALINEARSTGNTVSFELVNEGTERKGGGRPYVIFEYVLSICKGQTEEGLEGAIRCLAPNGSNLEPITRHLVAAATFKDGAAYLLTASSPVERWQDVGQRLRVVAESFMVD